MNKWKWISLGLVLFSLITLAQATEFQIKNLATNVITGWFNRTGSLNLSQDFQCSDCINPEDVSDIDDEDIETDLNTYVDIAGDTMTGYINLTEGANISKILDAYQIRILNDLQVDTDTFYVEAEDNEIGIGTLFPGYKLDVRGNINTTGNINASNIYSSKLNVSEQLFVNDTEVEPHREWGWSDESSWSHQLYLPFVYKHNLSVGKIIWYNKTADGKFDSDKIQHVCALYVNNIIYLYYSGYNGTHWQIGVLNATSPEGPYTRMNNGEPIIVAGGTGADDATKAHLPTGCMYDETETNPAMKYKIWYMGFTDGATTATALWAYAANPDGPWTKAGQVTGLNTPAWGQSVVKFGSLYVNLYSSRAGATYSFKVAISPNASNFKDLGTIMSLGSSGKWDDYFIGMGSLFWNSGVNYLLYQGQGDSTPIGLGLATTWGIPFRTLEKFNVNPILEFPNKGATIGSGFDNTQGGCLMQVDDRFYIWYHAANSTAANYSFLVTQIP